MILPSGKDYCADMPPGKNISEDNWLVAVDQFMEEENGRKATYYWLHKRLRATVALNWAVNEPYGQSNLFMRPCNQSEFFSIAIPYAHHYSNKELYSYRLDYLHKVAWEKVNQLENGLDLLDAEDRPSHVLLTYDDDYDLLQEVAGTNEKTCEWYLATKGRGEFPYSEDSDELDTLYRPFLG